MPKDIKDYYPPIVRVLIEDTASPVELIMGRNGKETQIIHNGWVATISPSRVAWFMLIGPYYVAFHDHMEFKDFVDKHDAALAELLDKGTR